MLTDHKMCSSQDVYGYVSTKISDPKPLLLVLYLLCVFKDGAIPQPEQERGLVADWVPELQALKLSPTRQFSSTRFPEGFCCWAVLEAMCYIRTRFSPWEVEVAKPAAMKFCDLLTLCLALEASSSPSCLWWQRERNTSPKCWDYP